MASPGNVPEQLAQGGPDAPVSDNGVASEHGVPEDSPRDDQVPPTVDPPSTAEAVIRILTAVEHISSKMDEASNDASSDEGSQSDAESRASSPEVDTKSDTEDDDDCPDIERLPMSSWHPPTYLSKRRMGAKQSIVAAFYTDVPTAPEPAEPCASDADFIAAYSKDKWISAPQRVLIHSKEVIDDLRQITSVPDSQRTGLLAMVPPFKYLLHHRKDIESKLDELKQAASGRKHDPSAPEDNTSAPEDDPSVPEDKFAKEDARIHWLQCIHDFIQTDLANYIGLELIVENGDLEEVMFEEMYHLFKPGDLVVGVNYGDDQLYQVTSIVGGRMLLSSRLDGPPKPPPGGRELQTRAGTWTTLRVAYSTMAWDGENIGPRDCYYTIPYFTGRKLVTDLDIIPIQFHKDGNALQKKLIARGMKYVQCAGHKRYTGEFVQPHYSLEALSEKPQGPPRLASAGDDSSDDEDEKSSPFEMARGDVYIDYKAYYTSFFSTASRLSAMATIVGEDTEAIDTLSRGFKDTTWNCSDRDVDGLRSARVLNKNRYLTKFGKPSENPEDDEDRLQLLPGQVPAFVFSTRKWEWLDINNIEDIDKSEGSRNSGWKELVIPPKFSELLLSLVSNHISDVRVRKWETLSRHESSDQIDLVRGKGRGLIILLHGPPGSGKTSTAETIAAYTGRPLYAITCGDLGTSAKELEKNLLRHTSLAQKWGCVLLLDEADVFLGSRTYNDMHRNAVVSVFLRQLEYYSGILFLTTNIVGVIDEAFKSRIHVALEYPAVDEESTLEIWRNLLQRIKRDNSNAEIKIRFDEEALLQFAKRHYRSHRTNGTTWNGRQIRNAFQTAIGIGQYERIRKIDEAESQGKPPERSTRYIKLSVASFATVAETTSDFERYITMTRGDDRERAAANEFRHDEHGRGTPPRKSYRAQGGGGSYRAELDAGTSRAGRSSRMSDRRRHGASSSPAPKRTARGKEVGRNVKRQSAPVSDSEDDIGQDGYRSGSDAGDDQEIIEDFIDDEEGDEDEMK